MQENRGLFTSLTHLCLRLIPCWILTGLFSVKQEVCSSTPYLFNFGICSQRKPQVEGLNIVRLSP